MPRRPMRYLELCQLIWYIFIVPAGTKSVNPRIMPPHKVCPHYILEQQPFKRTESQSCIMYWVRNISCDFVDL